MTEQTYTLYFEGNIVDGFAIGKVRQNLAALFKANAEQIDKLFSGERVAVKKNLDLATAEKYVAAMAKNGAIVGVVDAAGNHLDVRTAPSPAATNQEQTPKEEAAADAESDGASDDSGDDAIWSLAPVGADLLQTTERKAVTPLEVDVSHLSLESLAGKGKAVFGAKDLPEQVAADEASAKTSSPAPVASVAANEEDPSGFSLAEVGATLGEKTTQQDQALPELDLSDLSIADVGATLGEKTGQQDQALPELDLSDLSMADVGVDLVPDRPQAAPPAAPSTTHITRSENEAASG